MAHEINSRDTQTGIEMAWHGLTQVVECINKENCKIDYGMATRPLFIEKSDGTKVETEHMQIVSLDDELPIGKPVSTGYCLIDNTTIWDMVNDALLGMIGATHKIVSVGTVCDRSKGFLSIKVQEAFMAAARQTDPYLVILWGHGGNIPLIVRSNMTNPVCANTFNMVMGSKGRDFNASLKHSKNALLRIDNMGKAIEAHYGVIAEFKHAMDSFAATPCNEETARKIISGVIAPATFEKELKVATRTKNVVDRMAQLFTGGAGNDGNDLSDVFNAATDYYSHESSGGDNRMKQFVSSEFGAGQNMKDEFFNVLSDEDQLDTVTRRGEKVLMAWDN